MGTTFEDVPDMAGSPEPAWLSFPALLAHLQWDAHLLPVEIQYPKLLLNSGGINSLWDEQVDGNEDGKEVGWQIPSFFSLTLYFKVHIFIAGFLEKSCVPGEHMHGSA